MAKSYSQLVIADGASHYWRLNEATGAVAADSIGATHGAIRGGVTLGQPGALSNDKAMTFDGTTGDILTSSPITLTAPCSIECWFFLTAYDGYPSLWLCGGHTTYTWIYVYVVPDGPRLAIDCYVADAYVYLEVTTPLTLNRWHHCVVSVKPVGVECCLDGVPVSLRADYGSAEAADAVFTTLTFPFFIGSGDTLLFVQGRIDEVAIYPVALTAAQALSHYQARALPFLPGTYEYGVLQDGAIHYWRLNETVGTVAADSIGAAYGTIQGGVTLNQPGAVPNDKAMTFDGTDASYISLGALAVPPSYSYELWVKIANLTTYQSPLLSGYTSGGPYFGVSSDLVFVYQIPGGPLHSQTQLSAGQWTHIVLTNDGTTLRLYMNGVLDASAVTNHNSYTASAWYIAHSINPDEGWPGSIDEVAIYPLALTPAQVFSHYQARALPSTFKPGTYEYVVFQDGAIHYWPLDETTGTTVADRIGTASGTVSGSVKFNQPGALTGSTAIGFDGTGSIQFPPSVLNCGNAAQSFTIELWINAPIYDGINSRAPVRKGYAPPNSHGTGWEIDNGAVDYWFFGRTSDGPCGRVSFASAAGPLPNQWTHLVVTYNASTHMATAYVNGVAPYSSQELVGADIAAYADTYALEIGRGSYGWFIGRIDAVALYPTALTAQQVLSHYHARYHQVRQLTPALTIQAQLGGGYRAAILADSPLAYWRLNEKDGYGNAVQSDIAQGFWRLYGNANDSTLTAVKHDGVPASTVYFGAGSSPIADGANSPRFVQSATPGTADTGGRIQTSVLPSYGTNWTIEFWLYRAGPISPAYDQDWNMPLAMGPAAGGFNSWWWGLNYTGSAFQGSGPPGSLIFYNEQVSGMFGVKNVCDYSWHHIVMTCDGTTTKIYIDAVLDKSQTLSTNIGNMPLSMGSYYSGGFNLDGYLSNVAMYAYPLSPAQIAYHYALRTATSPSTTLSVINDTTGHGYNGYRALDTQLDKPGALLLDGDTSCHFAGTENGYIISGTGPFPHTPTAVTYEAWINAGGQPWGSHGYDMVYVTNSAGSYLAVQPTGYLLAYLSGTFSTPYGTSGVVSIPIVGWHHIVMTWDGNGDRKMRLYVDGELDIVHATSAEAGEIVETDWRIGYYSPDHRFRGYIDEVAVYNHALTATQIKLHYESNRWTDLTADVLRGDGVKWNRGIGSNNANDLVAKTGTAEFSLRNDERNSAKIRRWYSPDSSYARPGFRFGIPIRILVDDHPRWYGYIKTINPESGRYGSRRTSCTAVDTINDLAQTDIHSIMPQINQSEVTLLTAVINAMPVEARPPAINFDTSLESYPYAFDDVSSGVKALYAISQVMQSARGYYYQNRFGTQCYINRQSMLRKSPMMVFTDSHGVTIPSSLDNVFNRVRATLHVRTVNLGTLIQLYASSSRVSVGPSLTIEVFGDYSDPTNRERLLGGTNFQSLVAGTDYTAFTNADGTGINITANVTVLVSCFAASAKFTITNNYTATAFVYFQLRGCGIYDNAPLNIESFSPQVYGDRLLEVDLMYQADLNKAQDMTDYTKLQRMDMANQIESFDYIPQVKSSWLTHALNSEVTDVISITDDQTGIAGVPVVILSISEEFDAEGVYHVSYLPGPPQVAASFLIFDDSVYGVFDSPYAVFGFG